jgi:hypothetical protein
MYIVATLFRNQFWTIFTKATSMRQAMRYEAICAASRYERTRIVRVEDWDKESAARERERIDIAKRNSYLAVA